MKTNFRDKIRKNVEKQQRSTTNYAYLRLPKGVGVFTPEPGGRHFLDFLPYKVTSSHHPDLDVENEIAVQGTYWYRLPFKTHRNVGVLNETVVCPTSVGKRCPICEYRAKRIKEGAPKEETDALRPSIRNLYVVIPKKDKKHEEAIHIWDSSQFLFQNLLNNELEENEDYYSFADLKEGYTLKIRFDAKSIGKGQPFAEASRIDFIEREEQYDESILKEIPSLDETLIVLSYDELLSKFTEVEDGDDESEFKKPVMKTTLDRDLEKNEEDEEEDVREDEKKKPVQRVHRKAEREEEEEEETKVSDLKVRKKETVPNKPKNESKSKCPYGHVFGADADKYDDCVECKSWDQCIEEQEA